MTSESGYHGTDFVVVFPLLFVLHVAESKMSDVPQLLRPEGQGERYDLMHGSKNKHNGPTDSHVISKPQVQSEPQEFTDMGWGQQLDIDEQITEGLSNEDLWMLLRRFDKQLYYVKTTPTAPLQRLDLRRAEDEEFSPDKLRATLERFYVTVALGLINAVKHIARLRSWKEQQRTTTFCLVYFVAWLLDLLAPTGFIMLITLVVYPASREWMFPPFPMALVDSSTGGTRQPMAGHLGSYDSVTGASETFKGEAAEKEASNLVASIASLAVSSVTGKHDQGTMEEDRSSEDKEMEEQAPDPEELVLHAADAKAAVHGNGPADTQDKTKQPIRQAVVDQANLSMRVLSDITDTYERFGNALSPTSPFPWETPYVRFATLLIAALAVSLVMSSYVFTKLSTFLVGFGFFGDPFIWRLVEIMDRRYPNWKHYLKLENSLLRGIPTNAQLALTLLRAGEANATPLPPPPTSRDKPKRTSNDDGDGNDDDEEEAATSSSESPVPTENGNKQGGFIPGVISVFRGTAATGVRGKFAIDRIRAAAGSAHARAHLGILRSKDKFSHFHYPSGPMEFDCRYKGKRGVVIIDSTKQPALLYFTTDSPEYKSQAGMAVELRRPGSVLFGVSVSDISEMRKTGGLGWKGKLVVGWAIGGKEVVDGLLLVMKDGQRLQLTAMSARNQLFDRLIAIDEQVWESY